jgi:hypothetical protein
MVMTVPLRDNDFRMAMQVELQELRRALPGSDLCFCALIEDVCELAKALLRYREEEVDWPQVAAAAIQVAVMAQRIAVEGDPAIRDLATDPQGAPMLDDEAAALLPWIVSIWAIYHSASSEDDYYAVRRWEIVSDGLRPTPEINVALSLNEARRLIPAGLRRFCRHALDDPTVVEVWI